MSYTLSDIKLAAYNWTELPDMDVNEAALWQGLGYCYEWFRSHPEDKPACDQLAQQYVDLFFKKSNLKHAARHD